MSLYIVAGLYKVAQYNLQTTVACKHRQIRILTGTAKTSSQILGND